MELSKLTRWSVGPPYHKALVMKARDVVALDVYFCKLVALPTNSINARPAVHAAVKLAPSAIRDHSQLLRVQRPLVPSPRDNT